MTWQHWVVTVLIALAVVGSWVGVDKPREPRTRDAATTGTLINIVILMLLIWGQR